METLVSLLQPEKAWGPMDETPSEMLMLVRLAHSEKAQTPMEVTLPGMLTLEMLVQP